MVSNGTRFTLEVRPQLPESISRLSDFANDLFFSWENQISQLFDYLDSDLWELCAHNPKVFLRRISQGRLNEALQDRVFLEHFNRSLSAYDSYLQAPTHPDVLKHLNPRTDLVAYFCAEFGFHESLPIYSGGLGILAGDHCKAATDLGVPFVAVGLLYRQGYFTQTIDDQGRQLAHYTPTNFEDLPVRLRTSSDGKPILVEVPIQNRSVALQIWEVKAGHIKLFLLDSDIPQNNEADRRITYQLYGGDKTTRIQQEIVLGIGGVRALRVLGLAPTVWHINEGHAAFSVIERCREHVAQGMDFYTALELTATSTVFTTHTPVAAGHDIFDHGLLLDHLHQLIKELNIKEAELLALGQNSAGHAAFNQTALALRGSRHHNGVSRIHGDTASTMESYVWPEVPYDENPITYVTNGVHVPTFLARDWANLFDMRFGAEWKNELRNPEYWKRVNEIPDHIYWSHHQSLKLELFEVLHQRMIIQHRRNGCSEAQIERLTRHVRNADSRVLVIGFARRFATYKRATLIFSDPERLKRLLSDSHRPVLFVFAGKAHPKDEPGQQLIRTIHEYSRKPEFEGKILLVEGYDIGLARRLVSGVDVWLNTPEYPLEASGTSGEKAGINGVINLSVLDGWWGEGYNGRNGWAIKTHGQEFSKEFRDQQEGQDLLNILETQVIPLYFSRPDLPDGQIDRRKQNHSLLGYSEEWVSISKASMSTIIPQFNSQRMMMDYIKNLYGPANEQGKKFLAQGHDSAKTLAHWKQKVRRAWPHIRIERLGEEVPTAIPSGTSLSISVTVTLGDLDAQDVIVECVTEHQDHLGEYHTHECHRFAPSERRGEKTLFTLDLLPSLSGLQFYRLRIYPYHPLLTHPFETGFMRWL